MPKLLIHLFSVFKIFKRPGQLPVSHKHCNIKMQNFNSHNVVSNVRTENLGSLLPQEHTMAIKKGIYFSGSENPLSSAK